MYQVLLFFNPVVNTSNILVKGMFVFIECNYYT